MDSEKIDGESMYHHDFSSAEFDEAVKAAGAWARQETLEAGIAVFYLDSASGREIMELPDSRKFEIRYIPGAPRDQNYEVLSELGDAPA
jgi:hypothetical protein